MAFDPLSPAPNIWWDWKEFKSSFLEDSFSPFIYPILESFRQVDFWRHCEFNNSLGLFYFGKFNQYHKMTLFFQLSQVWLSMSWGLWIMGQGHRVQLYQQNLLIWKNQIPHFGPIRLWLHGHHLNFPEGSRINKARCQTHVLLRWFCLEVGVRNAVPRGADKFNWGKNLKVSIKLLGMKRSKWVVMAMRKPSTWRLVSKA